ncbi:MAG: sensor histidine kinase [Gammaproteobacteria bacterium]|nr:sensor histidine kinase [Gammaproteobacteria bacterium]
MRMVQVRDNRRNPGDFFLPDFCSGPVVLVVVLMAELTAFVLVIARHLPGEGVPLWLDLARISLFLQWIALSSAGVLCLARKPLARMSLRHAAVTGYFLLLITTGVLSEIAYRLSKYTGIGEELLPPSHGGFVLRNLIVCGIVGMLMLRYFYVQHQWKRNVQREARARIDALQARIRPHFLFNSMNTIAALIRSKPALAERTIEDLADLFRASLNDSAPTVTLAEEVEITRQYQRIEELRLGERLKVEWHTDSLPADMHVPSLLLQPLLENAIYHGIEPRAEGGTVQVRGDREDGMLSIEISNPLPPQDAPRRPGNQMALDNVRERLALAWPGRATLIVNSGGGLYRVQLRFPLEEPPP